MILAQIDLILSLLQQTCVYLVIAYLFSQTRVLIPLTDVSLRPAYRIVCYVVFSLFCIMGTYLGLQVGDSIANTRAIGAVLGGVLGGPVVGVAVGLTGGLHRYTMGGMTALACAISTTCEGLIGGLVYLYGHRKGNQKPWRAPWRVGIVTLVAEIVQMIIIMVVARPSADAWHLVQTIAVPMMLANGLGAWLFLRILMERRVLFESQILSHQVETQKELLIQTQIKLLHAQVNPHFLFNTLNTLSAVIRQDPEKARLLVQNLSTFFRKNLKRPSEIVSLADELEHIGAYLQIEQARFSDALSIEVDVPEELKQIALPAFSLQPLVENAIKHGTSQLLGPGRVKIMARRHDHDVNITVEDNAGLFRAQTMTGGLGMQLVDKRIKNHFGPNYGLCVTATPEVASVVAIRIPYEETMA